MIPPSDSPPTQDTDKIIDIYKLMVEMADRVSQRRQAANNFYLSINTALIGSTTYISTLHPPWLGLFVVSLAGVAVCLFWIRNITSYKTLNQAKFGVITEIEKFLPIQPFGDEWALLDPDGEGNRHKPFHKVEVAIPWIFISVHGVQAALSIPWGVLVCTLKHLVC